MTITEGISYIGEYALCNYHDLQSIIILNKECEIADSERTVPEYTAIIGYVDSTAYVYAQKWGRTFFDYEEVGTMVYSDVQPTDWCYEAIRFVSDHGIMKGLDEVTFGPGAEVARAQFAVILYRIEGCPKVKYIPKFSDALEGQWYTQPVLWLSEVGVANGYPGTTLFGVGDYITREQMAVMIYRYANYKKYDITEKGDLKKFSDGELVNDFALEAMRWMVGSGLTTGKDNGTRLDPQGVASRAECASIIMKFAKKYQIEL